ncbi:MAG: SDR family NAD(P)-dependent oxidoreductase [Microthrixaceae bacterium]
MDELEGRVGVITGAASGIGRAMALVFAAEGMHLALADVEDEPLEQTAELVRAEGVNAIAVRTDVSDGDAVEALAERTVAELGALHLACNNAGVSAGGLTWEVDLDTWDWVLGVNLFGVIHGLRSFTPRIIDSGGGHIVNTASMAGLTSPPGMSPYNVSKHAVVTLSEAMAVELSMTHPEVGISVLCPGWVRTRIHEADRNRPLDPADALEGATALDAGEQPALEGMRDLVESLIEGGLDPADVAEQVLDAVRGSRPWVLTHPEWMDMVSSRTERIIAGEPPSVGFLPGVD